MFLVLIQKYRRYFCCRKREECEQCWIGEHNNKKEFTLAAMARDTTATKKTQACSPFCCCIGEKVKGLGPCQGPRPWSRSRPLTLPRLEPRGHGYVGSGQPSRSRPRPCQRLKLTRDKPATLTSRCYCILRKRRKETGRKGHEDDIVTIEHNNKNAM